jgi:hypothetical protein
MRLESKPDPPTLLSMPEPAALLGPCGPDPLFKTVPVVITIPSVIPIFVPAPLK